MPKRWARFPEKQTHHDRGDCGSDSGLREPRTHAEALSQTVLDDEPAERRVPGRELIVQRFIRATGPEIDIHFKPWIVDAVVISPAPTVVVVPVVYLRNIEFAAGGKARGEI